MGTRLEQRHPTPWGTMRMDESSPPIILQSFKSLGLGSSLSPMFPLEQRRGEAQLWNRALWLLSWVRLSEWLELSEPRLLLLSMLQASYGRWKDPMTLGMENV